MDRINGADFVDIGGGRRGFRDEDLPTGVAGTEVTALFLNMLQEEVVSVISDAGIDLDPADWHQLLKAIGRGSQSGKWSFAIAGGTGNALTATLAPAPAALSVGMVVRLAITTANTGAGTLDVNGFGALPIRTRVNNPIKFGDLPLGAFVDFVFTGTTWQLLEMAYSEVPIVVSSLTLYVRTDGNDANNGLTNTTGGAFATIAAALNASQTRYFLPANATVTIQLGNDGVYVAPNAVYLGAGFVRIVGNTADKTARQINAAVTGSNSLVALQTGNMTLSYVQLNNSGSSGYSVSASGSAILSVDNVSFVTPAASTSGLVWAAGNSTIVLGTGVVFNGSSAYAMLAFSGSIIINANLSFSGTQSFSSSVAAAQGGGKIQFSQAGLTISGTASGKRYTADANGIINTGGGGANFFPGSIAGTTSNGGYLPVNYDPLNWLWKADDGRVFSSAKAAIVDGTKAATMDAMEAGWTVWPRDESGDQTDASLQDVLTPYGIKVATVSLEDFKVDRIRGLTAACGAAIVGGYGSAALGEPHTYPSGITDQINLMGSVTASLLPGLAEGWSTPFWCADSTGAWDFRMHTAAQIQQAGSDGKLHVVSCQGMLGALTAKVMTATTKAKVDAVAWPSEGVSP